MTGPTAETGAVESDAAHAARTEWPCDDYFAPLTCFTVPLGRKQPCEGCREAFPNGAEVQVMYRADDQVLRPGGQPTAEKDALTRERMDVWEAGYRSGRADTEDAVKALLPDGTFTPEEST